MEKNFIAAQIARAPRLFQGKALCNGRVIPHGEGSGRAVIWSTYEINHSIVGSHSSGRIRAGRLRSKQSKQFNRYAIHQFKHDRHEQLGRRNHQYACNQLFAEHEYKYAGRHQLTSNMNPLFKRIVVLLFISALVTIAGMGCNTANGFGKDMQDAGQGIQNGTK
jgi:predicted small secreted protein